MAEAERYIQACEFTKFEEKASQEKADPHRIGLVEQPSKKKFDRRLEKKEVKKRREVWTVEEDPPRKKKKARVYEPKFQFNTDEYSILMEIKDRLKFDKPLPMKAPVRFRDKFKYCHFHKDI